MFKAHFFQGTQLIRTINVQKLREIQLHTVSRFLVGDYETTRVVMVEENTDVCDVYGTTFTPGSQPGVFHIGSFPVSSVFDNNKNIKI